MHRRVPLDTPVSLVIGEDTVSATLVEASLGGVQISIDRSLEINETVTLLLETAQEQLSISAQVVHCGNFDKGPTYRVGLFFDALTDQVAETFRGFLGAKQFNHFRDPKFARSASA